MPIGRNKKTVSRVKLRKPTGGVAYKSKVTKTTNRKTGDVVRASRKETNYQDNAKSSEKVVLKYGKRGATEKIKRIRGGSVSNPIKKFKSKTKY